MVAGQLLRAAAPSLKAMTEPRYERIGTTYAATRADGAADRRVSSTRPSVDARSVVNVGAGAGSYEPDGLRGDPGGALGDDGRAAPSPPSSRAHRRAPRTSRSPTTRSTRRWRSSRSTTGATSARDRRDAPRRPPARSWSLTLDPDVDLAVLGSRLLARALSSTTSSPTRRSRRADGRRRGRSRFPRPNDCVDVYIETVTGRRSCCSIPSCGRTARLRPHGRRRRGARVPSASARRSTRASGTAATASCARSPRAQRRPPPARHRAVPTLKRVRPLCDVASPDRAVPSGAGRGRATRAR